MSPETLPFFRCSSKAHPLFRTLSSKLVIISTAMITMSKTFTIGKDLEVNRLGFGTMRLTGPGIWGEPKDPEEARRVLRRAVELGVNFIDTVPKRPRDSGSFSSLQILVCGSETNRATACRTFISNDPAQNLHCCRCLVAAYWGIR
jgi:hypothetical protein